MIETKKAHAATGLASKNKKTEWKHDYYYKDELDLNKNAPAAKNNKLRYNLVLFGLTFDVQ